MKLLEEIKKQSSKWIKTQDKRYSNFYWQNGYGIFSVYYKDFKTVKRYIENQKEHHQSLSFQQEVRKLFKDNDITFEERYVWD